MNFRWIWFVASRYIFRKQKKSASPAPSIIGIAVGVFVLIVIIAVMNGFQLSFIESILEISSYHLRVGNLPAEKAEEARSAVMSVPGVNAALFFREFQGLSRGKRGNQQAVLVRGLSPDAAELDLSMAGHLDFEEGFFDLAEVNDVLLGAELARRLGVRGGDDITLYSIPSVFSADENAGSIKYTVKGVFRTGFYEYDTGWVFMNIEGAQVFSETDPILGIKLKNRFHDAREMELVRKSLEDIPGLETAVISSWREYNRSFFGALRTEKLFMFILVGLIFIVVGLNIYQAQQRAVLEHREEIGLLRAIGGGEQAVRLVFVCDGAIIGFSGATAGLCLGLLIASNIPLFFTIIEKIVNFFINIFNIIANHFDIGGAGDFSIFSPAVFYIKEIPSRIIPREAVMIYMFGFLSALTAAWIASRRISRIRPAQVLRYE